MRPLVYRAVRGGHELRPVPPAAKALVAALSVPSSLLQWLEARLFVFDARCVEILCYTNSGDAPRKISILVVVSLWFGRLLPLSGLTQVCRSAPKKIFSTATQQHWGVDREKFHCESHVIASQILEHPCPCPVMIIPGIPRTAQPARQKALARRSASRLQPGRASCCSRSRGEVHLWSTLARAGDDAGRWS